MVRTTRRRHLKSQIAKIHPKEGNLPPQKATTNRREVSAEPISRNISPKEFDTATASQPASAMELSDDIAGADTGGKIRRPISPTSSEEERMSTSNKNAKIDDT